MLEVYAVGNGNGPFAADGHITKSTLLESKLRTGTSKTFFGVTVCNSPSSKVDFVPQ